MQNARNSYFPYPKLIPVCNPNFKAKLVLVDLNEIPSVFQ